MRKSRKLRICGAAEAAAISKIKICERAAGAERERMQTQLLGPARSIFMKPAAAAQYACAPVIVFAAADSISLFHHRRIRLSSHIIIARDNKVHYQCPRHLCNQRYYLLSPWRARPSAQQSRYYYYYDCASRDDY